MRISAIATTVNEVTYRSRLEARWAVVMQTLGWNVEYEPEGLASWRILDFLLVDWQYPVILEVKPVVQLHEFETCRQTLQLEARAWILDELNRRRKFFDELPAETITLEEYDSVLDDIDRVERGEDALVGRRAIVVGATLLNDPVRDGVTVDGQHYVLSCLDGGVGLGRMGERCLRCGLHNHAPVRASTVLGVWLASGSATQWRPASK